MYWCHNDTQSTTKLNSSKYSNIRRYLNSAKVIKISTVKNSSPIIFAWARALPWITIQRQGAFVSSSLILSLSLSFSFVNLLSASYDTVPTVNQRLANKSVIARWRKEEEAKKEKKNNATTRRSKWPRQRIINHTFTRHPMAIAKERCRRAMEMRERERVLSRADVDWAFMTL